MNTQDFQLPHAIALTGSIGSGKSTLVRLLSLYGYESICADEIAHRILDEQASEIVARFGEEIKDEDGNISRKKLGKIVFADEKKRKELEAILHPKIRAQILSRAQKLEKHGLWYFIDIPLFFESGGKQSYPVARSLVVYAPYKKALARIMKRDNISEQEARARLDSQITIEEKCRLADDIIGNDADLRALQQRTEIYLHSLPHKKRKKD